MQAAKRGYVAEFITGYLQREIRIEVKVVGGADEGLRDGARGIAVGRLVTLADGAITPAASLAAATHIVAQSDDTIREAAEDYNYTERYSTVPNSVVKNSAVNKTVALYKIVNKDDVKLIDLGAVIAFEPMGFDSTGTIITETYAVSRVVGSKIEIVGDIHYVETPYSALGLAAGYEFGVVIKNDRITSTDQLPTGTIVTVIGDNTRNSYTKNAFEADGSLILVANVTPGASKPTLIVKWSEDSEETYIFDLSKTKGVNV